jgi:hypothetical protein
MTVVGLLDQTLQFAGVEGSDGTGWGGRCVDVDGGSIGGVVYAAASTGGDSREEVGLFCVE